MAKTASPQVPGEPAPAAAPDTAPAVDAAGEETVTVSKSELAALMARIQSLEAAKAAPVARQVNPDAHLPDQDTIDPATIKTPVLTKQGWVVPHEFGTPAAAKRL